MQALLDKRQAEKRAAIRKRPLYDREIKLPVRDTMLRCLEFIPKKEAKLPVFFDFHGGGFTNGFPEEDDLICRTVCDRLGVRVFSIDYRLAPRFPYPEGQLDCYEAINYIVTHADEFEILTDRMVVCGHSAGGNHALTAAMRAAAECKFSFCGMILDYPPLDIATPAKDKFYTDGCIPIELSDLFNACYCKPEQAADPMCSPYFASDEVLSKLPPATVITCEIDSLRDEAEQFASRLSALGKEVTIRRFLGEKHAFSVQYSNPAALEAIELIVASTRKYLYL